jgi:general secretion pathway protein L
VELDPQAAANAFVLLAGKVPSPWLLAHLEPEGAVFSVINGRTISALTQARAQGRDPVMLLQAHLASLDQAGQDLKAVCWYGLGGSADLMEAAGGPGELEVISPQKLSLEGLSPDAVWDAVLPAVGAALRGLVKVPLKANLLPEADRAPVKLGGFPLSKLLLLTLFSLLFIWMGSALIHKRVLLYQVNKELAQITPEVKQVERLLEESRDQVKKLQSFRRMEQTPDKLKILKDLTTLIPENTWLFNLRLSRQTLEMSGMSKSASDLIPLLEKSGWLTKTEFASPIVTDASKLEHFKIKAEVKSLEPAS